MERVSCLDGVEACSHSRSRVCPGQAWLLHFGLLLSRYRHSPHARLKLGTVCGKRIAVLNNSQALMNVAGDMWGETNSNRHIMKSAQCLVSKETGN